MDRQYPHLRQAHRRHQRQYLLRRQLLASAVGVGAQTAMKTLRLGATREAAKSVWEVAVASGAEPENSCK